MKFRSPLMFALALAATAVLNSGVAHAVKARPGVVAVLEISAASEPVLAYLRANDYDVEPMSNGMLRVYATPEEVLQLDVLGAAYAVVEYQPNPPKVNPEAKGLGVYHNYTTLSNELNAYAAAHADIARLTSLGNSVQGRAVHALLITDNPDVEEDEPEIRYVANIHGDEMIGLENSVYLIDLLLNGYGQSTAEGQRITTMVDSTEIWIVPTINPDGLALGMRYNANGHDLNRNFPSWSYDGPYGNVFDGDPLGDTGRQTETRLMMQWSAAHSFTLSANFHGGEVVVNYPYDEDCGVLNAYCATPDDALMISLSEVYAIHNTPMWNSTRFFHGISNGSDWYTITGGLQDWSYRYLSDNDVTIELSSSKRPAESTLPTFWANNKESLLSYIEYANIGIRGVVTDAVSGAPVYARVEVAGISHPVYTDPDVGDYHRMLLAGVYALTFTAPGYLSQTVSGIVVTGLTRTDVELVPEGAEGEGEGEARIHTADRNGDYVINLSELLRVIQFFNSSGYHCQALTEDGFAPDAGAQDCAPHDSDYNAQDWSISLSEVLRAVQLFNSGGYHACAGGEDGFCPGP